jgi:hypothetical protein
MTNQQQSTLFRLPRELRDNIYEHHAHDEDGVFYDYASDKLRYTDKSKHEERNALTRSSKQADEEMQGVAMRANTMTFFRAHSDKDGICFNDLNSKAGRFETLPAGYTAHEAAYTTLCYLGRMRHSINGRSGCRANSGHRWLLSCRMPRCRQPTRNGH